MSEERRYFRSNAMFPLGKGRMTDLHVRKHGLAEPHNRRPFEKLRLQYDGAVVSHLSCSIDMEVLGSNFSVSAFAGTRISMDSFVLSVCAGARA